MNKCEEQKEKKNVVNKRKEQIVELSWLGIFFEFSDKLPDFRIYFPVEFVNEQRYCYITSFFVRTTSVNPVFNHRLISNELFDFDRFNAGHGVNPEYM